MLSDFGVESIKKRLSRWIFKVNKGISKSDKTGLCIKERDGTVTFQDANCATLCGDKRGTVCREGCMENFRLAAVDDAFERGIRVLKNLECNGQTGIDAVLVSDGCEIITLLYDKREQIELQIKRLEELGLTRGELAVTRLALHGLSNREIGEKLFISTATVRTHLNNIYKKLPPELKTKIHRQDEPS